MIQISIFIMLYTVVYAERKHIQHNLTLKVFTIKNITTTIKPCRKIVNLEYWKNIVGNDKMLLHDM